MSYRISEACVNCGACANQCPASCIACKGDKHEIDENECIDCGNCASVCPVNAPYKNES